MGIHGIWMMMLNAMVVADCDVCNQPRSKRQQNFCIFKNNSRRNNDLLLIRNTGIVAKPINKKKEDCTTRVQLSHLKSVSITADNKKKKKKKKKRKKPLVLTDFFTFIIRKFIYYPKYDLFIVIIGTLHNEEESYYKNYTFIYHCTTIIWEHADHTESTTSSKQ
jgi:hypothetical protein